MQLFFFENKVKGKLIKKKVKEKNQPHTKKNTSRE